MYKMCGFCLLFCLEGFYVERMWFSLEGIRFCLLMGMLKVGMFKGWVVFKVVVKENFFVRMELFLEEL